MSARWRTNRRLRALMTWALVAAVAACGRADAPGGDDSREPDRVRAIVMPYLTLMPFYIAREAGYFAEQGLEVEFIRVARNQEIMAALATGDVDVAGGMLTVNELALIAGGANVRLVAALGELDPEGCANTALVALAKHAESGALEDPERLRELVLDIDELIPIGYWADLFLRRYGLGIDDLQRVNLRSPATLEAMAAGEVDITLEGEPFVSMLLSRLDAVVWERMDALVPDWSVSVLMYGPNLLEERPEVGERLAVALLRAMRTYREGKTPSNVAIVAAGTGLEPERLQATCWPSMDPQARINREPFRGYQQWSLERGLVDRVLADEELYDDRFIDHANAVLAR